MQLLFFPAPQDVLNDRPEDDLDPLHDYAEFPAEDAAKLAMMRKQKTMMMKQLSAKKEFMLTKNHMMVAEEREKAKKEKMEEVNTKETLIHLRNVAVFCHIN